MSQRRKSTRGNPSAQESPSGMNPQPDQRAARGLKAFRAAERKGQSAARTPQRRPQDMKDGFLTEANHRAAEGEYSSPRILVYALLVIAAFMFCYLHLYAMPQLRHFAAGLSMPDARLTGYNVEDLQQLRSVMEDSAAGQLSFLHITAGVIFPVTFFLATWAVMGLLLGPGRVRWVAVAAAAVFAVVDITENILIDQALGQSEPSEGLVATASLLTQISWAMLIVLGAAVVLVVLADAARMRREKSR